MKFVAFLLAFLVLSLCCLPCMDEVFAENNIVLAAEQHQDASHHDDACSPFCHCACCAGFSINHSVAHVSSLHIFSIKYFAYYLAERPVEVSLPIWQPPQLS